ncbi:uncharacterized protein LOC111601821 [Drosophila hydei]|uniref:Uncharacterized protein LOC111601821 n=1 Tax=Drosophila hydei TaxID=7224 RepID=A0A6J1M3C4_DROHY|nr:uncharacterized protein LOC111601821 [Drosophila hydei]XP_023174411.2 uncharacterized protein LOC111601821 [Drosophila hydei]
MTTLAAAAAATTAMPVDAIAAAKMFSDADVAEVRHVVQRILVPCVFVIGLLGNSVSIYVLTRKRMRCTTNIYLTALAITDIAYLTFVLILSLKHYEYIKYHCELYWRLYGFIMWLCDACAYISIYIAVCFTIERFIAIRYPLKRQTFCTESLAKKVIAAVALFCLLTTLSTAFEHTYDINWKLIDGAYRPCNLTLANVSPMPTSTPTPTPTPTHTPVTTAWHIEQPASNPATSRFLQPFDLSSDSGSGAGEPDHIPSRHRRLPAFTSASVGVTAAATEPTTAAATASLLQLSRARRSEDNYNNDASNSSNNSAFAFNITEYCQNMTVYTNGLSSLGQNALYFNIWSVYTLIVFVLLPLFVLATFNCFLILLVHRSKSLRGDLTNASSIRRTKRKTNSGLTGSVSQENRVTITLIAVVLLFIVCQLPWAIYLILVQYMEIEMNIQRIAGNVCNLLVAINAAANFFLYCVLSDKYRKTVRELVTGYRYRHRHARNNISLYVPHTSTTLNGDGASSVGSGGGYNAYSGASSRRCRGKAAVARRLIA